ncbi:hypothetical protein Tco_0826769 [Tanacetum coccineum]
MLYYSALQCNFNTASFGLILLAFKVRLLGLHKKSLVLHVTLVPFEQKVGFHRWAKRFSTQRLEEDYHSIKDISLVSVYTTRNVTIRGMLIPDEFLTNDICATEEYKEYEKVFVGTPTPTAIVGDVVQKKKRKQVVGETSSLRKSLKVTIRKKQQSTTPIPPPSENIERDEIAEATLLSLTLHKTTHTVES